MTDDTATVIEVVLGYAFQDRSLLSRAFTHSSTGADHNETLACLGNRISGAWVARRIYDARPTDKKGRLTDIHKALCVGTTQADTFDSLLLTDPLSAPDPAEQDRSLTSEPGFSSYLLNFRWPRHSPPRGSGWSSSRACATTLQLERQRVNFGRRPAVWEKCPQGPKCDHGPSTEAPTSPR